MDATGSQHPQGDSVLWQAQAISIMEQVDRMPGTRFEEFVVRLLRHQGYSVRRVGRSGDGGVDLIGEKEGERYSIQCKRYRKRINRRAVSDAVGGLRQYDCTRAMVLTNSYLTAQAQHVSRANECVVADRGVILGWLAEFVRDKAAGLIANGDLESAIPSELPLPSDGATPDWLLHYLDSRDRQYYLGGGWYVYATSCHGPTRYVVSTGGARSDREDVAFLLSIGCEWVKNPPLLVFPLEGAAEALAKLLERRPVVEVQLR